MLYLLNTKKPPRESDTPVDDSVRGKGGRKVGIDAHPESSLGADPDGIREGFGILQVSRVFPTFFGYGFFQPPYETIKIDSVVYGLFVAHSRFRCKGVVTELRKTRTRSHPSATAEPLPATERKAPITPRPPLPGRPRSQLDMHRQSIASRSQFGQSSAQTATAQALRNKKKEYEAISALEQSCAELIVTLEEMATDLNTTTDATIGTISTSDVSLNAADGCLCSVAIGKAMEHWTDMFQILSISRALGSNKPPSQGYGLNQLLCSRSSERTRSAIASKSSCSSATRFLTRKTSR